jgi:hypothetical protein
MARSFRDRRCHSDSSDNDREEKSRRVREAARVRAMRRHEVDVAQSSRDAESVARLSKGKGGEQLQHRKCEETNVNVERPVHGQEGAEKEHAVPLLERDQEAPRPAPRPDPPVHDSRDDDQEEKRHRVREAAKTRVSRRRDYAQSVATATHSTALRTHQLIGQPSKSGQIWRPPSQTSSFSAAQPAPVTSAHAPAALLSLQPRYPAHGKAQTSAIGTCVHPAALRGGGGIPWKSILRRVKVAFFFSFPSPQAGKEAGI